MKEPIHVKGEVCSASKSKHSVKSINDRVKTAFLIMKLTSIILLAITLQVSASSSAQKVTLNEHNTSLKTVFKEVRKQTGYFFIYNNEVLEKSMPITLNVNNEEIEDALQLVFKNQPLTYLIEEKVIVVKIKEDEKILKSGNIARAISGKVIDEDGFALPSVSVHVQGTNLITTTDADGNYKLNLPDNATALQFTYIGYATQTVTLGSANVINVTLKVQNKELNEVVVQAYGTTRRGALTNAVSTITAKEIEQRPISNISAALVGAAPGLQTTTGSGQPGSGNDVRIRGFSSINGGVSPLYVVDGAPYDAALNNINPNDIESISVLKDASASALYGSRAASGVIIITTKRGKKNSGQINVQLTSGINSRALSNYETVNAYQYYPLLWESMRNSLVSNGSTLTAANAAASAGIVGALVYNPFNVADNNVVRTDGTINPDAQLLYGDDLNWKKALRRNGLRNEASLSYSGGADKSDYFVSLNYLKDEGYSVLTNFERFTGRVNVNSQLKKWLKTGFNIAGTLQKTKVGNEDSGIWENPFYTDLIFAPIYPVYKHTASGDYVLDALGNKVFDEGYNRPIAPGRNALAETEYNDNFTKRNFLSARTYGEISFLNGFKFTTNLSTDINNYYYNVYDSNIIGDGVSANGRSYRTNTTTQTINLNELLNYNKTFNKHSIDVLAGHENYLYRYNYLYGAAEGQIVTGSTELKNFANITSLNSYENNYRIESYLSRVQYNYDQKYFLSGSYRTDGSSKFAASKRWGQFWSVGAGWQINKESFFKADWVDLLKLRASYGQVGSDDLGGYYLYQTFYDTGYKNGSEAGIKQTVTLGNDKLVWESNNNMDVALEFGLFKNRLSGTVEYFNRYTKNLLFQVPLALSSGLSYQNMNFGTMYNNGWEIQLNGDPVRVKNFRWSVGVNWTTLKNKITELPFSEYIDGTKRYTVGHSRYDYWLRDWYGVDPATGSELYVALNPTAANTWVNDKGVAVTTNASNAQYHYAGSAIPKFYGSFNNTFTYKAFALDFRFIYQVGGKAFDNDYESLMYNGTYGRNLHVDALKRWQNVGDITDVPKRTIGSTTYDSDRWLIDASYLNLRAATLTYSLPKILAQKLTLTNARVFLSGENLFLLSHRKGFDPSQAYNGNSSYTYAPTRTVTLGVNVTL